MIYPFLWNILQDKNFNYSYTKSWTSSILNQQEASHSEGANFYIISNVGILINGQLLLS